MLERAPWDAIDDEFQARIPFDSPHESADLLARLVREGSATSHRLMHDGRRVGLVITRVDEGNTGRELVLVAAYCDAEAPLSREIADAVEALARAERCASIRFHTVRPAAARYAVDQYGFRLTELVLRKNVRLQSIHPGQPDVHHD